MLKNIDEVLNRCDSSEISNEENEGFDEISIEEVLNRNGLILYEITDNPIDRFGVDEDVIHELFPDFVINEGKEYLIVKDNKMFY